MFYSAEILGVKGRLAAAWIAARYDRKLTKAEVQELSIDGIIEEIEKKRIPVMALRTSSDILLGLIKILLRKTKIIYEECAVLVQVKQKEKEKVTRETDPEKIVYRVDPRWYLAQGGSTGSVDNMTHINNITNNSTDGGGIGYLTVLPERGEIESPRFAWNTSARQSISLNDISMCSAETYKDLSVSSFSGSVNIIPKAGNNNASHSAILGNNTVLDVSVLEKKNSSNSSNSSIDNVENIDNNSILTAELDSIIGRPGKRLADKTQRKRKMSDRNISLSLDSFDIPNGSSAEKINSVYSTHSKSKRERFRLSLPKELQILWETETDSLSCRRSSIEIPRMNESFSAASIRESIGVHSINMGNIPDMINTSNAPNISNINTGDKSSEASRIEGSIEELCLSIGYKNLNSPDRRERAASFFSLLLAVTQGRVSAEQTEPYSPIKITALA